ncbi:MAG TPA: ABC transporter permease [Alphaproteobacteria bacterium]|nr:ABC transporter permease [Alphaproteobacteria bacterium]
MLSSSANVHISANRTGGTSAIFAAPLILVMAIGFVLPLIQVFVNSFHPNTTRGVDFEHWTVENYFRLADPLYLEILLRTLRISAAVTVVSAILAYPVALFIARLSPRLQSWMILAYVSPWLVNTVVKALGWTVLLRTNGVINTVLSQLDLIDRPLRLLLTEAGVVIALVPGHFMFVLLPLWTAICALDPALSWAAGTLGATPGGVFRRVVLPLTLPALIAGLVINFIMNMTAFAIPMLIGGVRNMVVSMLAYQVDLISLDWPLGGALAVTLLAFTLALVWAGQRIAVLGVSRQAVRL